MIESISPHYHAAIILAVYCIVNILKRNYDVGVLCNLLGLGSWPTNLLWHPQWSSHSQYLLSYAEKIGS